MLTAKQLDTFNRKYMRAYHLEYKANACIQLNKPSSIPCISKFNTYEDEKSFCIYDINKITECITCIIEYCIKENDFDYLYDLLSEAKQITLRRIYNDCLTIDARKKLNFPTSADFISFLKKEDVGDPYVSDISNHAINGNKNILIEALAEGHVTPRGNIPLKTTFPQFNIGNGLYVIDLHGCHTTIVTLP